MDQEVHPNIAIRIVTDRYLDYTPKEIKTLEASIQEFFKGFEEKIDSIRGLDLTCGAAPTNGGVHFYGCELYAQTPGLPGSVVCTLSITVDSLLSGGLEIPKPPEDPPKPTAITSLDETENEPDKPELPEHLDPGDGAVYGKALGADGSPVSDVDAHITLGYPGARERVNGAHGLAQQLGYPDAHLIINPYQSGEAGHAITFNTDTVDLVRLLRVAKQTDVPPEALSVVTKPVKDPDPVDVHD